MPLLTELMIISSCRLQRCRAWRSFGHLPSAPVNITVAPGL